eukprot:628789_1
MQSDIALWSNDVIQCVALVSLLIFHIYRMQKLKQRGDFNGGISLCNTIHLSHVSYMIIISSLFTPTLSIITRISDGYYHFVDGTICNIIANTDLISALISHFGIHLFIAMRSRMSSVDIDNPSIFFKLGLILVSTDILLILYPFLFTVIQTAHMDGSCIITSKSLFFILWIIIQDSVIGVYSLCVFVIPLRKLITWEQHHSKSTRTDLQSLVCKVIICSSIMIFWTMISLSLEAVLGPRLSTLVPSPFIINSYCVVLQFAGIETKYIEPSLCRIVVGVIQCECCCTMFKRTKTKSVKQKHNISKMIRSVDVEPAVPPSTMFSTSIKLEIPPTLINIPSLPTTTTTMETGSMDPNRKSPVITPRVGHIVVPTPSDLPSLHLTPANSLQSNPSVPSNPSTIYI